MNQSNLNTSTKLYINETTNVSNVTIETFMQTISSVTSDVKGFVKLSKKSDTTKYIIFQITSITDNTSWYELNISNQSSSETSPFADTDIISVSFLTNGSKGDQGQKGEAGDKGQKGEIGTEGSQGTQGYTGYTGFCCFTGYTGFQGYQGRPGNNGTVGTQGFTGFKVL